MTSDIDFDWMDDVVKDVTLERAAQLGMSQALIDKLRAVADKADTPYLFRTTLEGGFSGEPEDDGTTKISHIGSLDSYLVHMLGWLESHRIIDIQVREAAFSKRKFRPVFEGESITLSDGTVTSGVGVDLKSDTMTTTDDGLPVKSRDNPRRKYHELRAKSPAEAERYWKRVKAAAKGWETRQQSPKAKAAKKRADAAEKKYRKLLKTDKEAAAKFKRRSEAAKKAAKSRRKGKTKT